MSCTLLLSTVGKELVMGMRTQMRNKIQKVMTRGMMMEMMKQRKPLTCL